MHSVDRQGHKQAVSFRDDAQMLDIHWVLVEQMNQVAFGVMQIRLVIQHHRHLAFIYQIIYWQFGQASVVQFSMGGHLLHRGPSCYFGDTKRNPYGQRNDLPI